MASPTPKFDSTNEFIRRNPMAALDFRQTNFGLSADRISGNYKPLALDEILSFADKAGEQALEQRARTSEQDIKYNKQLLEQLHPVLNKGLQMELKSKFPYAAYDNNVATGRNAINAASQLASSLSNTYTNSMARLNPVSMSL